MKKIYIIVEVIMSLIMTYILASIFFETQILVKILITPFLICSFAVFFRCLFLLLNKEQIADVFYHIYISSLSTYIFAFLIGAIYYSISHKIYIIFIIAVIFLIVVIKILK